VYKDERERKLHIKKHRASIFERAVHAYVHSTELGHGKRLSAGEIAIFALSETALLDRVSDVYRRRRHALSACQVSELKTVVKANWVAHHKALAPMRLRHRAEQRDLSRRTKRDWQQLRKVRNANLDQAFFNAARQDKLMAAQQTARGTTIGTGNPSSRAAVSPLQWVWLAFRAKLARREASNAETPLLADAPATDQRPNAVPDRDRLGRQDFVPAQELD
jgi:hypothetical protein